MKYETPTLTPLTPEERDRLLGGEWSGPPAVWNCRCVVVPLTWWERYRIWVCPWPPVLALVGAGVAVLAVVASIVAFAVGR